jgi:hypothetical protein
MKQFCYITLVDPETQLKELVLEFELYPIEIVEKWKQKVLLAQAKNYEIDNPQRFYGLHNLEIEQQKSLNILNQCIETINSYQIIIDRQINNVSDQDTLNYLHHIFEVYHGLLDQQTTEYWKQAPCNVKKALADLNIAVHRVESVQHGNTPRFVVTYFKLPKKDTLTNNDFEHLTNCFSFGGLYLNYVEIGKTLEDLLRDNDQYIHPEAFKPWNYFSADFKVILKDSTTVEAENHLNDCKKYFQQHKDFFQTQGHDNFTNKLKPGTISLGKLIYTNQHTLIKKIQNYQFVKSVNFV